MSRRRLSLLIILVLFWLSAAGMLGYGLWLHSPMYRHAREAELSDFLSMPCTIGTVRPLTFTSRAFDDVEVLQPDRAERIFQCRRAIWTEPRGGPDTAKMLDLHEGLLRIGSPQGRREEYQQLIRSSLGHDFDALRLSHVRLHDFAITLQHRAVSFEIDDADGVLSFERGGLGTARLTAFEINGVRSEEAVEMNGRFSTLGGVELKELTLHAPELSLRAVGLDAALRTRTTGGTFAGRLEFRTSGPEPELRVSGRLADVRIEELGSRPPLGPVHGRLNVAIDYARMQNAVLTHIAGSGRVSGILAADFAPLLGRATLSGEAELNVRAINASLGRLHELVLDGVLDDVSLEELSSLAGRGVATGRLRMQINALRVVEDRIAWADVEILAEPPAGADAGTIDRELLVDAAKHVLPAGWPEAMPPSLLPGRVEYARFGARLLVRDNVLTIHGTHGRDGDVILTLRVLGQPIPLVKSLSRRIDLTPWLKSLRDRLATTDPDELRDWWREKRRSDDAD